MDEKAKDLEKAKKKVEEIKQAALKKIEENKSEADALAEEIKGLGLKSKSECFIFIIRNDERISGAFV